MTAEPHPQQVMSCDSCKFAERTNSKEYPVKCGISKPIPMMVHEYCISWFAYVGCASHSDQQSEQEKPKFNSTDLLLLANDEWKRREERKHNHEHIPWTAGFINGFLTDKKWARDYIDKLRSKQGGEP